MDIENRGPFRSVGESEVDFTIVQLLETSADFRQWLVHQLSPNLEIDNYLGSLMHASYAGEGESDVEFGFRTATGDRHVVLIENKIDALKQPDQIERYFNRGRYRVTHGSWDSFTVCLLAPDSYISPEDIAEFDSVLRYEAVLAYLEDSTHDGAAFFADVFRSAMRRPESETTDASDVLRSIAEQFQATTEIPHFTQSVKTKKRIGFRSAHSQHPNAVQYDIYIAETGDTGRTSVRLQVPRSEEVTEREREAIKSIAAEHMDAISHYEWRPDRTKNFATTTVFHEEAVQNPAFDSYVDAIVDELRVLTETFHPVFVRNTIE